MGGRWAGGSRWGTHVNPWLIHVNVWQKPLQYCKAISFQLIKINEKKKEMSEKEKKKKRKQCSPKDFCKIGQNIFILIALNWKQSRYSSLGKWINCDVFIQ